MDAWMHALRASPFTYMAQHVNEHATGASSSIILPCVHLISCTGAGSMQQLATCIQSSLASQAKANI